MAICSTVGQSTVCPPAASISPCVCRDNGDDVTVFLNCYNQDLDDAKVSQILQTFLTGGVSPLGRLDLFYNQMTKVPVEIPQFPQLDLVYLYQNKIDSVKSGAFNFAKSLRRLDLFNNQITTIESGAFQGIFKPINLIMLYQTDIWWYSIAGNYANESYIYLYNNLLTRFESGVFQSVLEKMEPHYPLAYVDVSDSIYKLASINWFIDSLNTLGGDSGNRNCGHTHRQTEFFY